MTGNTIGGRASYKSLEDLSVARSQVARSSSEVSPQDGRADSPLSGSPTQTRNEKARAKWQRRLEGLRTVEGGQGLAVPKQVAKTKGRSAWAAIVKRVAKGFFSELSELKLSKDRIRGKSALLKHNYKLVTRPGGYKGLTKDQISAVKAWRDAKVDELERALNVKTKQYKSIKKSIEDKAGSLVTFNVFGHELASGGSVSAQVGKMDRTMCRLPEAVAKHVSDKLDAGDFTKAELGTKYPEKDKERLPLLSFPKRLGFTSSHFSFFNRKSTRLREQCRALVASVFLTQGADKALMAKEALMTIACTKGDLDNKVDDFFRVLQGARDANDLAVLAHKIIEAGNPVSAPGE